MYDDVTCDRECVYAMVFTTRTVAWPYFQMCVEYMTQHSCQSDPRVLDSQQHHLHVSNGGINQGRGSILTVNFLFHSEAFLHTRVGRASLQCIGAKSVNIGVTSWYLGVKNESSFFYLKMSIAVDYGSDFLGDQLESLVH